MKKIGIAILILAVLAGSAACANGGKTVGTAGGSTVTVENTTAKTADTENSGGTAESTASELAVVTDDYYESGSTGKDRVELHRINDRIWVHITYMDYNGASTPSNGLVAVTSDGLVLVDTPWTNEQTKTLLKLTKQVFRQDVTVAVITHAHEDRIGGIDTLLENGIDARCTDLTAKEAEKNGFAKPGTIMGEELAFSVGDLDIETYYPGSGHSPDNITVWFPQYKVLFGGCLLKSTDSKDKGSVTDADIKEWPLSVGRLLDRYPEAEVVIPGHGKWSGPDVLKHTLELVS